MNDHKTNVTMRNTITQAMKLGDSNDSNKSFIPPCFFSASGGDFSPFIPAMYSILSALLNDNTRNTINNVVITSIKKIKLFGDLIAFHNADSKNIE